MTPVKKPGNLYHLATVVIVTLMKSWSLSYVPVLTAQFVFSVFPAYDDSKELRPQFLLVIGDY